MNCQDVSLILDDRDAGALRATERHELDAHLAICPDCTRDWQVHTRLAATRVPSVPVELSGRIRLRLVAQSRRTGGWRVSRRVMVMGALFVAGAAAAMLVDRLLLEPAPEPVLVQTPALAPTPTPVKAPSPAQVPARAIQSGSSPVSTTTGLGAARVLSGIRLGPPGGSMRLQVMPLLNQATGEAVAAIDAEYAAFMETLRSMAGVTLLSADATPSAAEHATYRLTIRGTGPLPDGRFRVGLSAEVLQADGSFRSQTAVTHFGDIAPTCDGPALFGLAVPCSGLASAGPKGVATQQVLFVITNLALPIPVSRDPVALSRSVLSAASSANPRGRAAAWQAARGLRRPELLQPLINALLQDSDDTVRAHAAATLVADFADDPRARAALETTARVNSPPMVRAFAQQALNGNGAWDAYVVDSLMDENLFDAERLETLVFALEQPADSQIDIEGLLRNDAVIEMLSTLLARANPFPKSNGMLMLLTRLSAIAHPAVTNLLVDNLDRFRAQLPEVNFVYQLAHHGSDPRVRAALQKISSDDPDPNVRQSAAEALIRTGTTPAGAAQSPTR